MDVTPSEFVADPDLRASSRLDQPDKAVTERLGGGSDGLAVIVDVFPGLPEIDKPFGAGLSR